MFSFPLTKTPENNPLNLIEADFVTVLVIKLRRPPRLMRRNALRV
jgi:hypothetical protein